jgi:hypothetical protein
MRAAFAMLAAVLLLAGCGHAAAKDPFVGTWQWDHQVPTLVVAKVPGGYQATIVWGGWFEDWSETTILFARRGHELVGPRPPVASGSTLVLDYLPATGHLSFKCTGPYKADILSKASDSTATPSPSPYFHHL